LLSFLAACGGAQTAPAASAASAHDESSIEVPVQLDAAPLPRKVVATSIANPRGVHHLADGSLLVSSAGNGDPSTPPSGAILRLHDDNHDGDFDDDGERSTLLDGQPTKNILEIVRRDEVFGMAGIAEGNGVVLASLAFFGGPSTLFRIDGDKVSTWSTTHGNVNDLAFDPKRKSWYGVSSTSDEIVQLLENGHSERVVKVPPLASGQDPVPAYVKSDPITGELLVSLFSGSPEGEEGGKGVEIVPRSASVVSVTPETRAITPVITSLSVPTDFQIAPDGSIYVLEFCDAFLDPIGKREELFAGTSHGGFKRFSGRLLRVDRAHRVVTVVASGLDAPTNLELAGNTLYVSEGMGTPGRSIPGPDGKPRPLTGFIEAITLP
jgi:hypothetical protein